MGVSDFAYRDTMDEGSCGWRVGFMHRARQSQDDIAVRSYLWGAGRCLQEAVTIYDDPHGAKPRCEKARRRNQMTMYRVSATFSQRELIDFHRRQGNGRPQD